MGLTTAEVLTVDHIGADDLYEPAVCRDCGVPWSALHLFQVDHNAAPHGFELAPTDAEHLEAWRNGYPYDFTTDEEGVWARVSFDGGREWLVA